MDDGLNLPRPWLRLLSPICIYLRFRRRVQLCQRAVCWKQVRLVQRSLRLLSCSRSTCRDPRHRNPRGAFYRRRHLRGCDGRRSSDSDGLRTPIRGRATDRARSLRRPPRPSATSRSDGSKTIATAVLAPKLHGTGYDGGRLPRYSGFFTTHIRSRKFSMAYASIRESAQGIADPNVTYRGRASIESWSLESTRS
jgi:hypothetical protein